MDENQFQLIRDWAQKRGIYDHGDVATQFIKLGEEHGEFAKALLNKNLPEQIDAIGDMVVVLTNLAELLKIENPEILSADFTIEVCVDSAWNQIKDRQGKMQNGTFIKK